MVCSAVLYFFFFCFVFFFIFFFKQKTAYEIYQCDWSSDVCSSDLLTSNRRSTKHRDLAGYKIAVRIETRARVDNE